ncbi:MAG: hypothetical protein AAGJ55_13130, partial [Cyanobacteria bacterium J06555_12]
MSIRVGTWSLLLLALDSVPASALSHISDSLSEFSASTANSGNTVSSASAVDDYLWVDEYLSATALSDDELSNGAERDRGRRNAARVQPMQWHQSAAIVAQASETRADSGQVQTNLLEPVQIESAEDVPPPV